MFCNELWYTAFCRQQFTFTLVSVYVFIHVFIMCICATDFAYIYTLYIIINVPKLDTEKAWFKKKMFCFPLWVNIENVIYNQRYNQTKPLLTAKSQLHAKVCLCSNLLVTFYSLMLRSQILGGWWGTLPNHSRFSALPALLWFRTDSEVPEKPLGPSTPSWTMLVNQVQ